MFSPALRPIKPPNLRWYAFAACPGVTARRWILAISLAVLSPINFSYADGDDVLGYQLYLEGDFGLASELFTSTQWRGVALYKNGQWWRAAEAFIRGNTAASFHNLGNTYAQMGYYALALQAYQQSLAINPEFSDAEFNATIMKELIALNGDTEQGQGLLQPEELGSTDTDNTPEALSGSPSGGDEAPDSSDENTNSSETTNTENDPADKTQSGASTSTEASDGDAPEGDQTSVAKQGTESQHSSGTTATGNADSHSEQGDSQAAGERIQTESDQATEQWLNQIEHNPLEFLNKHIALEIRRRQANGQRAPEGGDGW